MAKVINIEDAKLKLRQRTEAMTKLDCVLECESPAEWRRLLREHVRSLQPANPVEMEVVKSIASARWRQKRLRVVETALVDYAVGKRTPDLEAELGACDDRIKLSAAFCWLLHQSDPLEMISRYEIRLAECIRRGMDELWQLRLLGPDGSPRLAA